MNNFNTWNIKYINLFTTHADTHIQRIGYIISGQYMILNIFLPFFLSFSLSLNWEREGEYIIGYRRNSLKVYLSLRRLSFGEYFLFLRVDGIYLCISLWLEGTKFLLLSKVLSAFFTRSPRPLSKNWFFYSLFPLTEEGATSVLGS